MRNDRYHEITHADLLEIREELEARRDGFKAAYPAPVILEAIAKVERLLDRLPK